MKVSLGSCFTSCFTLLCGGGRAGEEVTCSFGNSTAGRCLTEDDFTAVGPADGSSGPGLRIGPSSDSDPDGVGDRDAILK